MHLLKESTKPVPKQKKRKTIQALAMDDKEMAIPVIAFRPRASANNPATDHAEEEKQVYRSKRNKTPVNFLSLNKITLRFQFRLSIFNQDIYLS